MDYKEKYNKLVEAVKVLQEENPSDEGIQNLVNDNVPELRKSEDEKVREDIIHLVNAHGQGRFRESMLAWLEKQGQKKSITLNNDHVIDSALNDYCCKQYDALHKENGGVLSFARLQHLAMDIYGWCKEQGEQKSAEWSEKDESYMAHCIRLINNAEGCSISEQGNAITWLYSLKQRIGE